MIGTVPKTVKVDTLYWELAKPLAAAFPGATADVRHPQTALIITRMCPVQFTQLVWPLHCDECSQT